MSASIRCIVAKASPLGVAARHVLQRITTVTLEDGEEFAVLTGANGQRLPGLQAIVAVVGAEFAHPELFGRDARERAHVNQWVGVAADVASGSTDLADAELLLPMSAKTVAGTPTASVADVLVYAATVGGASAAVKSFPKLSKWAAGIEKDELVAPIVASVKQAATAAPVSPNADGAAAAKSGKTDAAPKFIKPNEEEIAARRAAKEKEKAEKERLKAEKAAAAPTAAGAKVEPAAAGELKSTELDVRVGLITSVDKHPKADRLFVETIDLGEPSGPRTIVSGLVQYYKAEDLLNRKVLVVANMKPKPLMGVESHGMVLCASVTLTPQTEGAEPVTQLELVPVPEQCAAGDRISIGGELSPALPAVTKKMTELLAPLITDKDGLVLWGDKPLATPAGVPLRSNIPSALVK